METLSDKTVGSLVARNYKTSAVFAKHGIDFCCGGGRSLADACAKKNLDLEQVEGELAVALEQKQEGGADYNTWPLDLLAGYIVKTHHRYVAEKIPMLRTWLDKLCKVHGERHPELFQIHELFFNSADELEGHMQKEELVLFPVIRQMAQARQEGKPTERPHFGTVQNPIAMMEHEHDLVGNWFKEIARLSGNYAPPADGCTTYRVGFATLKEFEEDLHKHIHLENNILFPRAIALEKELL
ncbi:MAG: iron-sulfur cluster repair di-iron protein [Saprospiraceae bacterium]|nr:MAG: iron-sulfur cluster repair di-iron protein [Saprospiraceae bacterium]